MIPVHRKCPVCGKRFFIDMIELWVYKRGTGHGQIYICSWKCLREFDRNKGKIKTPRVLTGRAEQIKNLLDKGITVTEISETLGVKSTTVYRWKYKIYEMQKGGMQH